MSLRAAIGGLLLTSLLWSAAPARAACGSARVFDGRVPIGGGTTVRINPPLVSGGNVQRFALGTNPDRVVYRADQEADNDDELYRGDASGGPVLKLNDQLAFNGDVREFAIAPNGRKVLYVATQAGSGTREPTGTGKPVIERRGGGVR